MGNNKTDYPSPVLAEQSKHRQSWSKSKVDLRAVQLPTTLNLGPEKSIAGLQRAYWASAAMSPNEYMRTVSFSSSQYVFQLLLLSAEKDAGVANAEFDQILADLKLESAKKGKTSKK